MQQETEILITGLAQLPRGTTLYEHNKVIGVAMVIDIETNIIKDVEFTFVAKLTNTYLSELVRGYNLDKGMTPLTNKIKKYCLVPSQGAIIQALRAAWIDIRNRSLAIRKINLKWLSMGATQKVSLKLVDKIH